MILVFVHLNVYCEKCKCIVMEFGNMEFKYLIAIPLDIIKFEINGNLLRSFSVFGSTKKIRKK